MTREPELKLTTSGVSVCTFTVAVNRRRSSSSDSGHPEADFFRVSAWRQLGENCQRFLAKGKKVCVIGPVTLNTFTANDGTTRASMEISADDVEFLSPRSEGTEPAPAAAPAAAPAPSAQYQPQQTTLQHPGNVPDPQEDAYVRAEREAIQNENKYVKVDGDELPF